MGGLVVRSWNDKDIVVALSGVFSQILPSLNQLTDTLLRHGWLQDIHLRGPYILKPPMSHVSTPVLVPLTSELHIMPISFRPQSNIDVIRLWCQCIAVHPSNLRSPRCQHNKSRNNTIKSFPQGKQPSYRHSQDVYEMANNKTCRFSRNTWFRISPHQHTMAKHESACLLCPQGHRRSYLPPDETIQQVVVHSNQHLLTVIPSKVFGIRPRMHQPIQLFYEWL